MRGRELSLLDTVPQLGSSIELSLFVEFAVESSGDHESRANGLTSSETSQAQIQFFLFLEIRSRVAQAGLKLLMYLKMTLN